ncbi:MAG: immune inhibitor A, partial [Candidatus Eisenbacteria bacterium]|nr:immune inhibitor A [Candidatus Eisenbacteria bacterium]
LARLGANAHVVDENPGRTAADRARRELATRALLTPRLVRSATRADGQFRPEVLPPVGQGSLGGFWNLTEIKIKLDDLVASDANGVVADRLDTLGWSLHHRPIWGLQLAGHHGERARHAARRVLQLAHACARTRRHARAVRVRGLPARALPRRPRSEVPARAPAHLPDPVREPGRYFYNQRIWDTTGTFGMWRKNLRDNNLDGLTGTGDGIDLNRNFGVKWGLNNIGSSGSPSSDVYRGPSAYSEPETQVQRNVVVALKPTSGLSFHTYSDLLVHPWGWTAAGTPDSVKFQTWSDELTRANGYTGGPGPRILYETNGDFNDFVYGDTLLKPKGFTFTPEMGGPDDGFWPSPSRVAAISEAAVQTAFVTAGIAGPWMRLERSSLVEGSLPAGGTAHVSIRARNIGASGTAGPSLQATLTAIDHEVEALTGPVFFPSLGSFQSADPIGGATFVVAAADTVTPGRMMRFRVDFTDGQGLHSRDTIEVVVGVPTVVAVHACDAVTGWTITGAGWAVKTNDPLHPSAYLSDSPNGVYANNMNTTATLTSALDLSHGVHAWAFFEDRWGYESDYDGGAVEASLDGTTWRALAGNGSTTSDPIDVIGAGIPAFEGTRWRWKQDRVDLSAFAGGAAATNVRLRFRSRADSFTQLDGLSIDSLRVLVYDPALQPAPVAVGGAARVSRLTLAPIGPNPARTRARLSFATAESGPVTLDVLDVQGRNVYTRTESVVAGADGSRFEWGWDLGDRTGRRVAPGLYLVRLRTRSQEALQRVVVLP